MTGYGIASAQGDNKTITVELRALNSKQLDLMMKLPTSFREAEADVRALLQALERGKIDVLANYKSENNASALGLNEKLFGEYLSRINAVVAGQRVAVQITAGDILKLPGVVDTQDEKMNDSDRTALVAATQSAMQALVAFRKKEGESLMRDILARVLLIEQLLLQTEPYERERTDNIRNKLRQALANNPEIATAIDQNRMEQEMIYYFEKLDVTEEKTRLRQHCRYFAETAEEGGTGRKLGFIVQEMGREINTLGSKANHSAMQHIVVQMKDELEKIKEQTLNIL
jgi:uncharacterized protein (TIGR00255 family)